MAAIAAGQARCTGDLGDLKPLVTVACVLAVHYHSLTRDEQT